MTAPHPEWPDLYCAIHGERGCDCKMNAALSRLRDAVEFIECATKYEGSDPHDDKCQCLSCDARQTLARIGPLPK